MANQMVFKRYELKYLLDQRQKEEILRAMEPHMALDRYGRTTIRNVYFDTDSYRLIRRQGGLTAEQQAAVLGRCREKAGDTLLNRRERTPLFEGLPVEEPTLEEIMVHLEKEGEA